ncbi:DNA polymerase III subunit epsilon [Flavobacterium psychrophilum]|uniref:DNA polymerase III subunit epsilon n=1 Tax=Flavobacterium psychrophilum TaxID=96345 RepID=UPI000B7C1847|nr:DNA polymerase III subunit epsilon [Flavobacterium psychrophilum]GEJ35559.1 DNA polymerase III subunit epsilon [Flavobacterium psychrophilum]GEJ49620.1 DNA polymerase III subunit epsilon [Flavobacterium psychrophilum]SNB14238.1 putative exonuclease [Flavobacterium psychrophilum]
MLDWLKKIGKDYPEFWKNYLVQFEMQTERKVALYIETTGINPAKDKIISIGAIAIEKNQIRIDNCLEIELNKAEILEGKDFSYQEIQAIESLINFIGNATLVGHRIHYDIQIINEYLHKLQSGRIKNNLLDVEVMHGRIIDQNAKQFSLTELLSIYKIDSLHIPTSANMAFSIALLFLKLKSRLKMTN